MENQMMTALTDIIIEGQQMSIVCLYAGCALKKMKIL